MRSFLQATGHFLRSRSRFDALDRISREWRFINSDLVPSRFLVDIFPEVKGKTFGVSVDVNHHFELPYGERCILAALAEVIEPKVVFEFGTYSGSTTILLAEACGSATEIHTLDLPNKRLIEAGIDPKTIGHCVDENEQYNSQIEMHREDSREFDFFRLRGLVDLVYIDGSHEYDDVLRDSRNAIEMLSEDGVIVWDDYHTPCIPVAEAIDVLAEGLSVSRITGTRLVVYRSSLS